MSKNTINDNLIKIKSLQEIINLRLNYDLEFNNCDDEITKTFNELIKSENEIELKLNLIPLDLKSEVQFYIDKQYSGDAEKFIKSSQIYFDTFTAENLIQCNTTETAVYKEASSKGRRKLKRDRKIAIWHASCLLKLVGRKRAKYACNTIFNEFKKTKKKEFDFIENCKLVGNNKKVFELKKCVRTPEQLIAEKLNLLNVQERIAQDRGWTWCFITLTLEGHLHANPSKGSKSTYDGTSPYQSAREMNTNIKRVRSLMNEWGIKAGRDYTGASSAECHKDGVLHKHMIIFADERNIENIRLCFQYHFPNLNNQSFRVESEENKMKPFKKADDEYIPGKFRERAASYVFKYVMKSINTISSDLNFDELEKGDKNALLNSAFRSYNCIRGFSFFGIENCLTKFRFIARNLEEMNLPAEICELVKNNDLYTLLTNGYFNMFENVYIIEDEEAKNRTFVGCKFLGRMYFKRFFTLVRNISKELDKEVIESSFILKENRESYLKDLAYYGDIILVHNYSRKASSDDEITFKWILQNPFLFLT